MGTLSLESMEGIILGERYRLLRVLGSGAMGQVYEAEQLGLGRAVAVKMMRVALVGDPASMDRFRTEALAASRINHPHAVAIFDFGVTQSGLPYLVMERLRGRTLASVLAEQPLAAARVATVGAQILSAVAEAHTCGVIHRDLKSDNVVLETLRDGSDFAKVLDFGIARLVDRPAAETSIVGTPEYMAPEQIRGEKAGPAADLYAVGIILYEMLVGRTPFAGVPTRQVLERHMVETPRPPQRILPTCPAALGAVVLTALEKDPARRFADAEAMRGALLAALNGASHAPENEFDERPDVVARGSAPTALTIDLGSDDARATLPRVRFGASTPTASAPTAELGRSVAGMVGRAADVGALRRFYRGGDGTATLALVGRAGIGKARLVLEVARELAPQVVTFVAAADPTGLAQSWVPVVSMLEAVLGLPAGPTLAELTQAVARAGLPERDVPGLAELFALPGPLAGLELAPRRREAHASALRTLRSVHLRYPGAVMCFFNVQHYDGPSRALVAALAEALDGTGARLLITAERAALAPPGATVYELPPLEPHESHALAMALCGAARATVPPVELIQAVTGGAPAAIEHLAGWLGAGNDIATAPERLVDLVAARLGQLPVTERRVLQAVAAQGQVASRLQVAAALGEADDDSAADHVGNAVAALVRRGLLVATGAELTIPSELVAEVAADCTPADVRRALARAFLNGCDARVPAAVVAHHAERANELDLAAAEYVLAGDDAARRFDDPGAASWYWRALRAARQLSAVGEPAGPLFIKASIRLANVLRFTGELKLAIGCLEETAVFDPDVAQQAGIARARGRIALTAGDPKGARGHLERAIGLAYRAGDREFLCDTYIDLATALTQSGSPRSAVSELAEALDALTLGEGLASASRPRRLWLMGVRLAELYLRTGDPTAARTVATGALAQAGRTGSATGQGRVHALLAAIAESTSDDKAALEHRAQALDHMRRLGDRRSTAELLILCASSTADLAPFVPPAEPPRPGEVANARRAMEIAYELSVEIGWKEGISLSTRTREFRG